MTTPSFRTEAAPVAGVAQASALTLIGSMTLDEAPAARTEILEWLASTDATRVVLELSAVSNMDTSGAAVLAEAIRVGRDRERRVLLCSPSDSVLRIFRLAGFEEVLQCCCADLEETRERLTA